MHESISTSNDDHQRGGRTMEQKERGKDGRVSIPREPVADRKGKTGKWEAA